MIETQLYWLNKVNGADLLEEEYATKCLEQEGDLIGVVMGSAYGGAVEHIAKLWIDRGNIYGYDVFEDLHPKHLSSDKDSFPATCMDWWYANEEYGTEKMNHSYQQQVLKDLKRDNAELIKGEVNKDSCKDLPYINYAFLDMDMVESMRTGFNAVKNKIKKGGFVLLHDTQNIGELTKWRDEEVLTDKRFKEIDRHGGQLIVVLERI